MNGPLSRECSGRLEPAGTLTTFGSPARPETLADRAEFLSAGLRPVSCADCAVTVLVKKNSPKHTSVQWTSPASDCPLLAAASRSQGCPQLADTIRAAAREGVFGD